MSPFAVTRRYRPKPAPIVCAAFPHHLHPPPDGLHLLPAHGHPVPASSQPAGPAQRSRLAGLRPVQPAARTGKDAALSVGTGGCCQPSCPRRVPCTGAAAVTSAAARGGRGLPVAPAGCSLGPSSSRAVRWFGSAAAPAPCWHLVSAAMEVLCPGPARGTAAVGVLGLSRQLVLGCWGEQGVCQGCVTIPWSHRLPACPGE